MRNPLQFILDQWTGLSHQTALDTVDRLAPTWVGSQHVRRLNAYRLLEARFRNRSRTYRDLPDSVTDEQRDSTREYGDVALLVKVVRSAVTGDDVSIVVPEAAESARARRAAPPATDTAAAASHAENRLAELEAWATSEWLVGKVMEVESDAQRIGDGLYVFGVDVEKERTRLRVFDAGFYFPDLDPDRAEDEFPQRVDIAWEFEVADGDGNVAHFVRRITWTLGPIRRRYDEVTFEPLDLRPGDREDPATGIIWRTYPYASKPSRFTCYLTDATWRLEDLDARLQISRWALDDLTATLAFDVDGPVRERDLGYDFIPVVHLPNTIAIKDHFGEALITSVAQLIDDLIDADTDAQKAAALAAVPVIGYTGSNTNESMGLKPGMMLGLGPGGKLDTLDMSAPLTSVLAFVQHLLDRLSTNVRVPAEVLGRVQAGDVEAGIIFLLSFGPLRSLVAEQRMVRREKYRLMLKMLQRMQMVAGYWAGPVVDADIAFGQFLPTDVGSVITNVLKLHEAKVISRKRAITMLVEAGVLELDIAQELEAAQHEDFVAALALLDATDDRDAAAAFLGLKLEALPPPPPVVIPNPAGDVEP